MKTGNSRRSNGPLGPGLRLPQVEHPPRRDLAGIGGWKGVDSKVFGLQIPLLCFASLLRGN